MGQSVKILSQNPLNSVLIIPNNPILIITEKLYNKFFLKKQDYTEVYKEIDDSLLSIFFREGKNFYRIFFESEDNKLISDFAILLYHKESSLFVVTLSSLKFSKLKYEKVYNLDGFVFWDFVSKELSLKVGYTKNSNPFIAIKVGDEI